MFKILFHLLITTLLFSHASLSDGLVAHYEFEGNANDSSGNGNHGTPYGGVGYVDGVIGQTGSFDGVDDYVDLGNTYDMSFGGTKPFSFSLFSNSRLDYDQTGMLISRYDAGNIAEYYLHISNNELIGLRETYPFAIRTGSNTIIDNKFHHITFTYDGIIMYLYIDGVQKASVELGSSNTALNIDVLIGADHVSGVPSLFFKGEIDDLRIYNRALTETEIQELYELGQPEELIDLEDGLVAHYEFEGNANDSSGNGNHGTPYGGVTYDDGVIGQAGSFDGVSNIKTPIELIGTGENQYLTISFWGLAEDINNSTFITNYNWGDGSSSIHFSAKDAGIYGGDTSNGCYQYIATNLIEDIDINTENNCGISNYYYDIYDYNSTPVDYTQWQYYTITYNNQSSKIFINGIEVVNRELESNLIGGDNNFYNRTESEYDRLLNIGMHNNSFNYSQSVLNNYALKGKIDDLRIYNRALTEAEIKALYLKGTNDDVEEKNSFNLYETAFTDLTKEATLSYAILDQSIYTSVDEVKFVQSSTASVALNAISSTPAYVVGVGDGGKVLWQQGATSNEVIVGSQKLLDVANDGSKFVVVGEVGTVYVFEPFGEVVTLATTGTTANIVAITYDEGSSKYYAVSDAGEFLSSSDGLSWSVKTVDASVMFSSLEVEGDIVVLVGKGGVIYTSTDLGVSFTQAVSNTTSDILDVWRVGELFVASTSTGLLVSVDGINWLPDSRDFGDEVILGMYEYDDILYVMTSIGARSLSGFQNITTGDTTKATVAKVDIEFDTSTMTFNAGELETFNITPNDTMWIKHKGKNVAKLILGDDVTFTQYSENSSTLEKFLFKHEEYVEINGESTLYYNIGDDVYKPVSQGAFWLRDGKVYEKPLFTALSDNSEAVLKAEIDRYITDEYTPLYDASDSEDKKTMMTPAMKKLISYAMVDFFEIASKRLEEFHVTKNSLLLGSINQKFSPFNITSPYFRQMYIDVAKEEIKLKDSYFILPTFSVEKVLSILKLKNFSLKIPTVEFTVSGHEIKGIASDLNIELGAFEVDGTNAEITSSLNESNLTEEISVESASFTVKTIASNSDATVFSEGTARIGSKATDLKFAYSVKNGYQLLSGEGGGSVQIPKMALGKTWTLDRLQAYFNIKLRELDTGTEYIYTDDYSDDLGKTLFLIGGDTSITKGGLNNTHTFSTKIDLSFGMTNNFTSDNIYKVGLGYGNKKGILNVGALTVTKMDGNYTYNKYGVNYWSLGGDFRLYKFPLSKSASLFKGSMKLSSDFSLDNLGIDLSALQTEVLGTPYYLDWMSDGGACILAGKSIGSNFPVTCPSIADCTGGQFELLPEDENTIFSGGGLGVSVGVTLKKRDKNGVGKVYTTAIGGLQFVDIIKGSLGAKFFVETTKDKYSKAIEVISDVNISLPRVDSNTTLYKILPSNIRDGFSLGRACITLGTFEITQEYSEWLVDKTAELGKHFGIYMKINLFEGGETVLFYPLDKLTDKDGEQLLFVTDDVQLKKTTTPLIETEKQVFQVVGDLISESYTVGADEKVLKFDLSSTDNELTITDPIGQVFTQDTVPAENMQILKSLGKYTMIIITDPIEGAYEVSYKSSGNEEFRVFGANREPIASITTSPTLVSFDLSDSENDSIEYSLILVDEAGESKEILKENTHVQAGSYTYTIPAIGHLETGNYRIALYFKDAFSPMQKVVSTETIHLIKSIDAMSTLNVIATNEFTQIDWNIQAGVSGYNVALSLESGELLYEYNITSTQYTFDSLLEGDYSVSVYPYDDNGLQGGSATQAFSVTPQADTSRPLAVQSVSIGTFTEEAVLLDWTDVADAMYYEVNIYKDGEKKVNNFVTSASEFSLESDFFAQHIKISIVARNSANNGSEEFAQELYVLESTDSDADSLPDMWEYYYFGHLLYGADEDYDVDSLTNIDEYTAYTNPSNRDSDDDRLDDSLDPNPNLNEDKNTNYVADDWESYYSIDDILADGDGDGYANYIEYMVGMNPNEADEAGLDVSAYETRDYAPVLVSNIDDVMIISKGTSLDIDLSGSYDINGNALTYEWIVNASKSDEQSSQLSLDTSVCGMKRVEVNVNDGETVRYKKFSIFVSDAEAKKVYGGTDNTMVLEKYELEVPKASMKDNSYLVASDISQGEIPVDIMGRQIISDGMVYFYSDASKLESFITITPYIKDTDEIDPYIFNYDTSIWTNLVTGETFDPIFRMMALENNDDKSYTLQTRETGILIFAKKPIVQVLSSVMNLDLENEIYSIDLDTFKVENSIESIEHVTVSNQDVLRAYLGEVNGQESLQLSLLSVGITELTIIALNTSNERVSYSYIVNVDHDTDGDGISDLYDLDIDGDGIPNSQDAFPRDSGEWLDTDNDGIGNNADMDDDNDGISDILELENGLDPLDPLDADADFDGDGISNRDEILAGTNPHIIEINIVPILYLLL